MALLEFVYAAYIGVFITILIGIFVEGEKAQMDNVLGNLSSFFLLLATADMSWPVILGLSVYLCLGIFIVYRKIKDLYLLFGAKSYGSISLVILFANSRLFGLSFEDMKTLLIAVLVMAAIVHSIGFIYTHRGKRRPSGHPDKKKGTGKKENGRKKGRGKKKK